MMTDEAKRCVEHLRNNAEFQWCSDCYISDGCGDAYKANCYFLRIANLFESLSAELEQVKRERDAAVEDLHMWGCFSCKHAGYAHSEICASCVYNRNRIAKGYVSGKNRYEWRGVKEG